VIFTTVKHAVTALSYCQSHNDGMIKMWSHVGYTKPPEYNSCNKSTPGQQVM